MLVFKARENFHASQSICDVTDYLMTVTIFVHFDNGTMVMYFFFTESSFSYKILQYFKFL